MRGSTIQSGKNRLGTLLIIGLAVLAVEPWIPSMVAQLFALPHLVEDTVRPVFVVNIAILIVGGIALLLLVGRRDEFSRTVGFMATVYAGSFITWLLVMITLGYEQLL